jgi:hypothetical protein
MSENIAHPTRFSLHCRMKRWMRSEVYNLSGKTLAPLLFTERLFFAEQCVM